MTKVDVAAALEIKLTTPLVRPHCCMGIFPEIQRAWITLNNRLLLWDYTEGYYLGYNIFFEFADALQV